MPGTSQPGPGKIGTISCNGRWRKAGRGWKISPCIALPGRATATLAVGRDERDLDFAELRELTRSHLQCYQALCGQPFPQDPGQQLSNADEARRRTATLQAEDLNTLRVVAEDGHPLSPVAQGRYIGAKR